MGQPLKHLLHNDLEKVSGRELYVPITMQQGH